MTRAETSANASPNTDTAGAGGVYESMPYDSMPFAQTRPSSLAALARFYGIDAAPADECRVLELGCASGGNIIPLAARFPAARFVGIDLSDRHVAMAGQSIAALSLGNIAIRQGDLADPNVVDGEYDYILCHGVYSWVPAAAQKGILDICARHLAPRGLAYVSYNVLPGWQLRKVIRDILRLHVGDCDDPRERVARGREMLNRMAAISREDTPYGQLVRHEARLLATYPDSYILGEFLVDENHPCYFREFVERAGEAGLAYLADTDLRSSLPEMISPEFGQVLAGLAGPDPLLAEQYFDFVQGRQFRQSVLLRKDQRPGGGQKADPRRLADLHFSSQLRLDSQAPAGAAMTLREPKGKSITTNDPAAATALDQLGAAFPETRSFAQLMDGLAAGGPSLDLDGNARKRLLETMARLIVAGLVQMSSVPIVVGRAANDRPAVWRVARQEHAAGQPWLTNLRHMPVKLDAVTCALLPLVDGEHDRASLVERLRTLGSQHGEDADLLRQVQRALDNLEDLALLDPSDR